VCPLPNLAHTFGRRTGKAVPRRIYHEVPALEFSAAVERDVKKLGSSLNFNDRDPEARRRFMEGGTP
jgi:hypothetical protein